MRALSIRQPWAFAILSFGKRVENRQWRSGPSFLLGQTFLLHASKGCTVEEFLGAAEFMRDVYRVQPWAGATIIPSLDKLPRGAIVGRARLAAAQWATRDPWAIPGALGLILADVERIATPIPFKGSLGFFEVPDSLLAGAEWSPVDASEVAA